MCNPQRLQLWFRAICIGSFHQMCDESNYVELLEQSVGLKP
jgi:hypothetical protein